MQDYGFMAGPTNPMNIQDADELTRLGRVMKMLQDPNILRLLAETGAGLGSGQNFGQALGQAGSASLQRQAFAKAAAQQSQAQDDRMSRFLNVLRGGNTERLLGPKEDPNTANSITFTPDGTTVKFPNSGAGSQMNQSLTDKPLESYKGSPLKSNVSDARTRQGEDILPFL